MRLTTICWQCSGEDIANGLRLPATAIRLPFRDSAYYEFKCPRGHQNSFLLDKALFEVLAESGLQAIADGYYREGVSSFASSLERFYEYYWMVVNRQKLTDVKQIEQAWKAVSAQTERQIGLFIGTYFAENRSPPPLLGRAAVKFRNEVIHKGRLPSQVEATTFAQEIVNLVQPQLDQMRVRYADGMRREWLASWEAARPQEEPPAGTPGHSFNSVFDMHSGRSPLNLTDEVIERRKQRDYVAGRFQIDLY